MTKYKIIFTLFLCMSLIVQAQKDVEFKVEKEQNKLLVYGFNNTGQPLELTLTISDIKMLKGYTKPITKLVEANDKILFIELSFEYDFFQYKLSYSRKNVESETVNPIKKINKENYYLEDLTKVNEGIVVFDDEDCFKCRQVIEYLVQNNLNFKLISLANNKSNQKFMWKMINEKGASLNVKLPIIVVDGKLTHSHPDLEKFLKDLN